MFENPRVINALYVSLQAAALNVVIAVGLGVLAGLGLARRNGRWTRPFLFLLLLVLFTPELVVAIGLLICSTTSGSTKACCASRSVTPCSIWRW